jgi:hypothetical protein
MDRHPDGDWCRHEDVEYVLEAKDARIAELEREVERLRAKCEGWKEYACKRAPECRDYLEIEERKP